MKLFKNYLFILCCLTITVLTTACLGDDDDERTVPDMTPAQKTAAIQAVKGNYSGKFYFYNPSATTTLFVDSVDVNWTITEADSTFLSNNIPLSVFANYVDDMSHRNILQAGGNITFRTILHPYRTEKTVNYVYYLFSLQKDNSMKATVEYEGQQHTVTINLANIMNFNNDNYSPYADCWSNLYTMRLYVDNIIIDGFTYDIRNSSITKALTFTGEK